MAAKPERTREPLLEAVDQEADQLRALVNSMLSGTYQQDFYLWDVASLCRSKPTFAHQLLALIDRYERLGQMPSAQHQMIRQKIEESLAAPPPAARAGHTERAGRGHEPASTITTEVPVAAASTVTAPLPAAPEPPRAARPAPARGPPPVTATPPAMAPPPPLASALATHRAPAPAARVQARTPAAPMAPAAAPAASPDVRTGEEKEELLESVSELLHTLAPEGSEVIGPGTVLRHRYELQGLLGFGGMASVFKAVDRYRARLGLEDCCVALKIVAPHPPNPSHIAALGREFHNAQQLSHPHIINVYEIDHEGDASFYTMELLEGEQLTQLLERIGGVLPRSQALAIIRDIGSAIAHAHSRGVVHADLKPQNIFVTYGGQVRVLDFGGLSLSAPAPQAPTAIGQLPWIEELPAERTATAYRTATPAYASCEQLEGHRADARDDLFALGCIAYELLTGRHPFDGRSATQARAQQLRPRRPADLRAPAWRALRSALAWHRAQRPAQVSEWLAQLGVDAAVDQLPPSHQLRAAPPPHVWPRRIAAAVLLFLLAGIAALIFGEPGHFNWQQTVLAARGTLQNAREELAAGLGDAADATRAGAIGAPAPSSAPVSAAPVSGASAAAGIAPGTAITAPSVPAIPIRARERHRAYGTRSVETHDTATRAGIAATDANTASPREVPVPGISAAAGSADSGSAAPSDAATASSATGTGVSFASSSYNVADGAPAARLIVRRTGSGQGELRFVWWTQQDTAKADVDYAPLGRRVERIPRGADAVAIYVPIISNPLRHRTESFYVALGAPGDVDPASPAARATVTIERGG